MAYSDNFVDDLLPLIDDLVSAEGADYSKLIFEKVFLASDVAKDHTVVTGVRNGSLIPIINGQPSYTAFPFTDPTVCTTTSCDIAPEYSGKKWDLGLIGCRVPICLRTFNDNFLKFWNSYKMLNPVKAENGTYMRTALLQYITDLLTNSFEIAKWRVLYFGDTGEVSNLLSGFDGWFTQARAVTDLVVPIAKNDGLTFAAQQMTGLEIYDTLVEMEQLYDAQEWAGNEAMEFRMGKKLARTLASYLNGLKDSSCCDGIERLEPDNVGSKTFFYDKLTFHGIPIRPYDEWDKIINNVPALNGGGGTNPREDPNRIMLVNKSNLLIGTEEKEDLKLFDIFYDKRDRQIYIDLEAYLGAGLPRREFILAI